MSADSLSEIPAPSEPPGGIVPWACPECSGTIWESKQGPLLQFCCRVGHAYSAESFLQEQTDTIERTLWAAIRLLEERAALADHLAQQATSTGDGDASGRFIEDAARHRRKAAELRRVIGL